MVTLPIEKEKKSNTFEIDNFKEKCVEKLESLCIRKEFYKRPYYTTFTDIRNSIAHFNIKIPKKEKIEEITLKAYSNKDKKGNTLVRPRLVFSITISVENLKEFAKFVATEYLKIV